MTDFSKMSNKELDRWIAKARGFQGECVNCNWSTGLDGNEELLIEAQIMLIPPDKDGEPWVAHQSTHLSVLRITPARAVAECWAQWKEKQP